MEMTIEEHIKQLKKLKSFHNGSYGLSVNVAIDTMRKYQRIEQIVDNTNAMTGSNGYACAFIDIREVVEDGNNNYCYM